MDKISKMNVVHKLEKRSLLIAINCVCGLSIFFFGYDQGMMGGVNNAPNYLTTMGIGYYDAATVSPVITNTLLQGGIVSIYYLGTLIGCLVGGWFGEKYGRIKTIGLGAGWAVLGATLQCSAQNHVWMIFARLINGWGTGILNAIIPVWATETAEHTSRGQFIAIDGCNYYEAGYSSFVWRFPIAFQIAPLLFLFAICWYFPDSPRWLTKVGREEEARYILGRLRGETGADLGKAEAEFQDIRNVAALERKTATRSSYIHMLFGIGSGKLHTGRRVELVIWLQIMQEWVGIAGVTIYAPTIFRIAGVDHSKAQWVSGLNNIFYMFSTLICVFTLDRIGRRWTLYWGSVMQGIAMFLAGGLSKLGQDATAASDAAKAAGKMAEAASLHSKAAGYGIGAVAMVFLFTFTFGATWLTVPWLYPAEIFPLECRAKGNAWGVVGWSVGNGWLTLLCPVMFAALNEKTYYVFGAANVITLPMVWALYPESNQRTLEEMDLLFAADTPWNWDAERNFALLKEQNPELVQAAARGNSVVDPETGLPQQRRRSTRGPGLDVVNRFDGDESPDEKGVATFKHEVGVEVS
ncbi:MAG: hypothetical protein M1836_004607 [Candelina mexicana]|nr:MAG: hypothetical protein M1836_004607 [Candelina mexicana]